MEDKQGVGQEFSEINRLENKYCGVIAGGIISSYIFLVIRTIQRSREQQKELMKKEEQERGRNA